MSEFPRRIIAGKPDKTLLSSILEESDKKRKEALRTSFTDKVIKPKIEEMINKGILPKPIKPIEVVWD